ncbi:amino acid ABC transporter substrate-binding protein, PAAT family [Mariprofundus ferrinatatus]|uniref:Amino acid ABC transporter substrate-binding protein, PAAT family n=1 Tax=Mariprofundus ferrinatatus TaxID=1921087 RepID=A0A2K8L4E7_9PROT|nr:ABC transporter substrate-binding protein [Mariprofundus ferrinatatus]ATX82113.1 amino acid ABC transporter substrate-binding protein, PAAT family [Mariprofundus ferrinatatus]
MRFIRSIFPPFISSEVADGGPFSEIVRTALSDAGIDAVIATHPIQRMVRYYLLQEQAMAVMGRHLNFSSEEKKELIYIPVAVLVEKFFYYKPTYPDGLNWSGSLDALKGKTYGAHKGENTALFTKAGVSVKEGRSIGLLKQIAAGQIDFAAMPVLTGNWLLKKYMSEQKDNFATMERVAGSDVFYIIFNKKDEQGVARAASFRKALSRMVDDGRYAEIMKKHLGNGDVLKLYMGDIKGLLAR